MPTRFLKSGFFVKPDRGHILASLWIEVASQQFVQASSNRDEAELGGQVAVPGANEQGDSGSPSSVSRQNPGGQEESPQARVAELAQALAQTRRLLGKRSLLGLTEHLAICVCCHADAFPPLPMGFPTLTRLRGHPPNCTLCSEARRPAVSVPLQNSRKLTVTSVL